MILSTLPWRKVRSVYHPAGGGHYLHQAHLVSGVAVGQGQAPTRKEAKQIAAIEAIRVLQASG